MVSGISSSSSFSTASLSEMRQKMFNKIDTNGDGSIDKTEMSALLQQNTSQDTSSLVDKIFSTQDTDQNGLISLIESNSTMEKLGQEMKQGGGISAVSGMPPSPDKVFDTADTDKDGFVSKDELAAVMGQNVNNIDKLFSKVDTDGDGLISRTEDETFRKQMTERMQQNESTSSGTNNISGFVQDLQSKLFDAVIKGFTAAAGSSGESTSLYV
jgi:Ca2+-binding EF-hand superfamily protein